MGSMLFLIFGVCLFNIFSTEVLHPDLVRFQEDVKDHMELIVAKNNRTLGRSCNYAIEAERKALEKSLLGHMTLFYLKPEATANETLHMVPIVEDLANLDDTFCNTFANLECSLYGVCQCAEEVESVGFKTYFQEERGVCVLRPGAMCAAQEIIDDANKSSMFGPLPPAHLTCSRNADCIVKRTHDLCTVDTMQNEFERMTASRSHTSTDIAYQIAKANEGICICKGVTLRTSVFLILIPTVINVLNLFRRV